MTKKMTQDRFYENWDFKMVCKEVRLVKDLRGWGFTWKQLDSIFLAMTAPYTPYADEWNIVDIDNKQIEEKNELLEKYVKESIMNKKELELELVKREFRDHLWDDIIDMEHLISKNDWKLIEPKIDWNKIKIYTDKVRNWGEITDENEEDFTVEFNNRFNNVMNYLHKLKEKVNPTSLEDLRNHFLNEFTTNGDK